MEPIVWLHQAAQAGDGVVGEHLRDRLGGKAASLVRLLSAGLPVPEGFVVCAGTLAGASSPAAGTAAGGRDRGALPPAIAAAIRVAYAALGDRMRSAAPLVAVRSSGTAEDLAEASFAGQYETFLGVRGAEEVVTHVARCWQSLRSPRAVTYRERITQRVATGPGRRAGATDPQAPQMAVLVQVLVAADAAGVAFTADPVTGMTDRVQITGAWGLGPSVVDGEVEPDVWQVARDTLATETVRTGHKTTQRRPTAGAAQEAVRGDLQDRPCLTDAHVAEVARLALAAARVLGAPADVEWARTGDAMWVLQARPITGLPAPHAVRPAARAPTGVATRADRATTNSRPSATLSPAPPPASAPPPAPPESAAPSTGSTPWFPFRWADPADATRHWTQRAVDGRAPEVMPPLELDVRARWARTLTNAQQITGPGGRAPRLMEVNGRHYWHDADDSPDAPGDVPPEDPFHRRERFARLGELLCERGENYLEAVTFPEMRAGNRRLAAVEPDRLPPDELAAHLEAALRWFERGWTLHWARPEANPGSRFATLYTTLTGDPDREAARALLLHEPTKMTEAVDGLIALARIAQRHPVLRARLASAAAEATAGNLEALEPLEGGPEFRRALRALLEPERQGLRCGASWGVEQNQCLPGWREAPHLVIGLVQRYLLLDLDALARGQHEAVARRDARVEALRRTIADEEQRRQFDFWLAAGRRAQCAQEDHNYFIDSATNALLHRAITACGRRLAAAGQLTQPEDVWWLREHEVLAAVRGLAETELVPSWAALVAAHRAVHAWQQTLRAPATLGAPTTRKPASQGPSAPSGPPPAALEPPPAALLVQGQPASVGTRTGRVRVVRYDAPDGDLPVIGSGEVLVAHQAGALWGPLAPATTAIVLEVGGPFMHIMSVCREFGIPGVVNARGATERLREGQRVTVDGAKGWVLAADD